MKSFAENNGENLIKVVILAGGKGTRLSEETHIVPKPLIEIGGKPILQHIIEIFATQGFSDFILATGYKSNAIVGYFLDSGMGYEKIGDEIKFFFNDDIKISIVNTGMETQTGGRLGRLQPYLTEPFFMTYGDGVSDVSLLDVLDTFYRHQSLVTLTAVHPEGRFGSVYLDGDRVSRFGEKVDGQDWINGGFMVVHPKALNYICKGDETNWESDVLPEIARDGYMTAYRHEDFWACLDTLRDKERLENIYANYGAIWTVES